MGTRIEAIIFDGSPETAAMPEGVPTVPMAEGLTILPVTRQVLSRLDAAAIGDERPPGS